MAPVASELLRDALGDSEGDQDLRDELARIDRRLRGRETVAASVERGLRSIRSVAEVPSGRVAYPPYTDFQYGGFEADVVDEIVASLERYDSAPGVVQYLAGWGAIRSLITAGYLDHADGLLPRYTTLVERMQSRFAADSLAYLRGRLAIERHEWRQAVQHFSAVSLPIDADRCRSAQLVRPHGGVPQDALTGAQRRAVRRHHGRPDHSLAVVP